MKINDQVKINEDTNLFILKSEAIAYALTCNIDYKPYNWFDSLVNLYNCGKTCPKNCEGHEEDISDNPKIYDVLDYYELDKVKLVLINSRGYMLWTSFFEPLN